MKRFLPFLILLCALFVPIGAQATLTQVQHKFASSNASANTVVVTVTALGSGNLVIVGALGTASDTISGVADGSNTYVQATSCRAVSAGGRFTDVWYAKNSVSGPTTVTVTFGTTNTNRKEAYVHEVSGAATSAPFDACGTLTDTGNGSLNLTGAAVTTVAANTYIIGLERTNQSSTNAGAGGGFTNDDASNAGASVHRIVSAQGAYTPTYVNTGTSPTDDAYSTASFKAASGGGATFTPQIGGFLVGP